MATNGDKIRKMSDDEIAVIIEKYIVDDCACPVICGESCDAFEACKKEKEYGEKARGICRNKIKKWLKQEAT